MISQDALVEKLDKLFTVTAFDESATQRLLSPTDAATFQRYAVPTFLTGLWNGLALSNAKTVNRVYCIVFPGQNVLDKIIAREVERGDPGTLIFAHSLLNYVATKATYTAITDAQLAELKEHRISLYICHAPLDAHPELSPAVALANALKLREQTPFAGRGTDRQRVTLGIYGNGKPTSFHDFAKRCVEVCGLPGLRYDSVRHNGQPVQKIAVLPGIATPDDLREAAQLGCDTLVTGEWWVFGMNGDAAYRDLMLSTLADLRLNLIGTSHFASNAVVMRKELLDWFRENIPAVEPVFVPQDDPWH